ncbi:MAG: LysR family transcriptional regulator, partial [Parachlamydiaceae bacterium]|nr:LysR family transcriptional regulator [Parachlamydiaceae bacterium]
YISHSMRRPDNQLLFLNNEAITLVPYIRVNDAQTMVNLALEGLGIVMLHHYVVKEHLESGALQEILTSYIHSQIPIFVAYPQRRFIASKVRCFIDFITEKISKSNT